MKYRLLTNCALSLCFLLTITPLHAQGINNSVHFNENRVLTTEDGWQLQATYYNTRYEDPGVGSRVPVVLLLPGDRGNRLHWEGQTGFATKLQEQGFAVITLDPRKYGESKPPEGLRNVTKDLKPNDYASILKYDLEAVKEFLFEEHQQRNLNMAKMAIVAPESLAPVALGFTVRDWKKIPYKDGPSLATRTPRGQDVKAVAVISPKVNLPGISGKSAVLHCQPVFEVAICTMAGENDSDGKRESDLIYTYLTGSKKPEGESTMFYNQIYSKFGDRGTELVSRNAVLTKDLMVFLDRHVKQLNIPWQDRRSKFER
ncbi:MAG: hypothetical protein R3C11_09935 [Planctomycetaceae bacterium]